MGGHVHSLSLLEDGRTAVTVLGCRSPLYNEQDGDNVALCVADNVVDSPGGSIDEAERDAPRVANIESDGM